VIHFGFVALRFRAFVTASFFVLVRRSAASPACLSAERIEQ